MNKIACIVVTYNRLELLKRCIKNINNQTLKNFDIIVVNNGSTDGTNEWLSSQADDITSINQVNLGGAGGFYAGMVKAYNEGYEWLWMMDDDGVADEKQLEILVKVSTVKSLLFTNALVCRIDDHSKLSFGLNRNGELITSTAKAQEFELINSVNPFNGTFINRIVIDKIGFIKKEMFIWGDEAEYMFRAKKNGLSLYTITSAIHFHPSIKGHSYNAIPFWSKYNLNVKPVSLSHIYYRNLGYLYNTYMPNKVNHPKILYTILFIRKFMFVELMKFHKYYKKGMKNLFTL